MNDGSTSSSDGKVIVAVKIDRCWNRYWRLFLFLGVVLMSCLTGAMWMSMQSSVTTEGLLETEWRSHWSKTQSKASASKTVFEQGDNTGKGINVEENEETFEDYLDEDDEDTPYPDEPEYYEYDRPDVPPGKRVNQDYVEQYQDEVKKAAETKPKKKFDIASLLAPEMNDYSLQPKFYNPFKGLPEEFIKFDSSFSNPCWAESIPRFPYSNNSYLLVSQQARILEPQFQAMRKKFAARQDQKNKWRQRCLPAFYVMESPPWSTPSLYTMLGYHPSVVTPQLSEPEYWNQKGPAGIASLKDYLDLYDAAAQEIRDNVTRIRGDDGRITLKHTKITGDGTSSLLWTFDAWRRVHGNEDLMEPKVTAADVIFKFTPLAKFVFVLRNPTDRLLWGYLSRTDSPSATDFHDKAGMALEKMSKCSETRSLRSCLYDKQLNKMLPVRLRIGMYYPFIADWLRVFPQEQIKVIRYEDYVSSPSAVINEVCNFLGLPPFPTKDLAAAEQRVQSTETKRRAGQKVKMMTTTKAMLKEFHRHLNRELATLLEDDKFMWPELEVPIDSSQGAMQGPLLPAEMEKRERRKKKQKLDADAIKEARREQILKQKEKMSKYREKVRKWAEEQAERRQKAQKAREEQGNQTQQPSSIQSQQQQQPLKVEQGEKQEKRPDQQQQQQQQQPGVEQWKQRREQSQQQGQQQQGADQTQQQRGLQQPGFRQPPQQAGQGQGQGQGQVQGQGQQQQQGGAAQPGSGQQGAGGTGQQGNR